MFRESKTRGIGYASRKDAKDAKFGNIYLFFATLAFFARDIPKFGCGSAALSYLRQNATERTRAQITTPFYNAVTICQKNRSRIGWQQR